MVKKVLKLLFVFVLAFPTSTLFVQSAPAQDQMAKQDRWEGNVVTTNPDKSRLSVRKVDSNDKRFVSYDSSTKWVSQAHASKTVADRRVQKIVHAAERLLDHPFLGKPSEPTEGAHELQIAKLPYLLPYRVVGERIEILQVFDESLPRPEGWTA